jgi:hypothetical protein|tara:strand:- start:574 stop:711 length:138 start_codon:yes stop_codon:yes gene_type:complete
MNFGFAWRVPNGLFLVNNINCEFPALKQEGGLRVEYEQPRIIGRP